MLEQIRSQIEAEITGLMHELHVDLPERIKIAREHGDLRENSEFKAAKERQAFVEARLNHLITRMTELSKIDVTDMAYDRVGFGSTVTIHDIAQGGGLHLHDHRRRLHRPRCRSGVACVAHRSGSARGG